MTLHISIAGRQATQLSLKPRKQMTWAVPIPLRRTVRWRIDRRLQEARSIQSQGRQIERSTPTRFRARTHTHREKLHHARKWKHFHDTHNTLHSTSTEPLNRRFTPYLGHGMGKELAPALGQRHMRLWRNSHATSSHKRSVCSADCTTRVCCHGCGCFSNGLGASLPDARSRRRTWLRKSGVDTFWLFSGTALVYALQGVGARAGEDAQKIRRRWVLPRDLARSFSRYWLSKSIVMTWCRS